MLLLYTCPAGHQWESTADGTLSPPCPTCGDSPSSVVEAAPGGTVAQARNVLPPRPTPIFPEIPGYEILGELGRGGMGVVYQARQRSLNRVVALKMILTGADAGPKETARFRSEAEAVARLQHPNIVQIFEVGEHQGRLYFSLEYMDGGGLNQKLRRRPQPPRDAAALVETLARAMHHAHQRGVVHRDLKPANVLLTGDGLPKIADFGLAKYVDHSGQTATGAMLGTPSYMAPEQAQGQSKKIGPPADVWALGAILYELLTGRPPFRGETLLSTLAQVLTQEPVPPHSLSATVPPELEKICLKCLQKDPAQRYANAAALADDLHRFLAASPPAPRKRSLLPWILATGVVVAALLVLAALPFLIPGKPNVAATGGPPGDGKQPPNTLSTRGAQTQQPSVPDKPYWEALAVNGEDDVFQRIAFPTRNIGYVAGRRTVYKTIDGGRTWRQVRKIEEDQPVHELHFQDEQIGWMASDRLWQTTNGGADWTEQPLPGPWKSVRGFAAGADGWMLAGGVTTDGDVALAQRPDARSDWKPVPRDKIDLKTDQKWLLTDLAIVGPRTALAAVCVPAGEEGTILSTTDGGESWGPVSTTNEAFYCVRAAEPGRVWTGGAHGVLRATTDGGSTWTPAEFTRSEAVTRLAFAPDGTGFGLAPLWKGNVLRTTDAKKWEEEKFPLDYSTPDAPVVDAGCAYVLGSEGQIAHYVDPRVAEAK